MSDELVTPILGADPVDQIMSIMDRKEAEEAAEQTEEGSETDSETVEEPTENEAETEEAEAEPDEAEEISDDESEPEETAEETDEETEEPVFTVRVNGQDYEVTLDELQKGYSRMQDYTAKTEAVAKDRRDLAEQKQQFEAERQNVLSTANQILQYATNFDPILAEAQQTDWAKLAQEDPQQYIVKKEQFETRQREIQQLVNWQQEQSQTQVQQFLDHEHELLTEQWPEWGIESERTRAMDDIRSYLKNEGFDDNTINSIKSHRALLFIKKAMDNDKALKARSSIKAKRVDTPPKKVVKPNVTDEKKSGPTKTTMALKQRAIQTGRLDDKVDAAMSILDNT